MSIWLGMTQRIPLIPTSPKGRPIHPRHECTGLSGSFTVNLIHNQITRLPDSIENATKLRDLRLFCNPLTSLPEAIYNRSSAVKLRLSIDAKIQKTIPEAKRELFYLNS
jgi:Leucine-rich repeat (LRR) protein